MRYVAAYLLAALGGNASPSAADIEKVLSSVGIESDKDKLKKVRNVKHPFFSIGAAVALQVLGCHPQALQSVLAFGFRLFGLAFGNSGSLSGVRALWWRLLLISNLRHIFDTRRTSKSASVVQCCQSKIADLTENHLRSREIRRGTKWELV